MEKTEFQKLFSLEHSHWWYVGLHELVHSLLIQSQLSPSMRILDAGCGTGGLLKRLQPLGLSFGMDLSSDAIAMSRKRGIKRLVEGSILNIPFADETFDRVISLDVLYHSNVIDEQKALTEFHRVMKKSGKLILNLPAFEFLRSTHDRAIHTRKRYTRKEINQMLQLAGFEVEKISYRNFILFPVVLIRRFLMKYSSSPNPESDLRRTPAPLNAVLLEILRLENRMLKHIHLLFGSSVFCIARKTDR